MQSVSATLLPPERLAQCEIWKTVYADLLLRSELFILRAEVMQYDFAQQAVPTRDTSTGRDVGAVESGIGTLIQAKHSDGHANG